MKYQVVVEYRPKLRACQFFIKGQFDEHVSEIEVKDNIVVILSDNSELQIKFPDTVIHIINSVSGLCFTENSICFRTRTKPDKIFGSFEREFILSKKKESLCPYKPPIKVGKSISIYCRHCLHQLTTEVCFERVLPLPLSSDVEDYFCHFEISTEDILTPRLGDCLYCLYFYKVHPALFQIDICDENVFECPNCSAWLGIITSSYAQLWNSTTIFSDCVPMASNDVALEDFFSVINDATSEMYSGGRTNKLLLQCTIGKENNCRINEYLLIWIMERVLSLFTCSEQASKIELNQENVSKLLYLHETKKTETINEWLNSNSVTTVPVARNMFMKGIEHLQDMSYNIPKTFRITNGMNISYIRNLK